MVEGLHTIAGIVFLLLPGALYVWSYERLAGQWRVHSPDRILTFVGASIVFHALAAPVSFYLWHRYWHGGALRHDSRLPFGAYLAILGYVIVPVILGFAVGFGTIRRWWIVGRNPRADSATRLG